MRTTVPGVPFSCFLPNTFNRMSIFSSSDHGSTPWEVFGLWAQQTAGLKRALVAAHRSSVRYYVLSGLSVFGYSISLESRERVPGVPADTYTRHRWFLFPTLFYSLFLFMVPSYTRVVVLPT
jgi:hypothetical protein